MKTILTLCLLALAGCSVVDEYFAPVPGPQRVVGPVYKSSTGEDFPGPVYYHYPESIRTYCGPGEEACTWVWLDDNGRPIPGQPIAIFLPWIQREAYLPDEECHALKGAEKYCHPLTISARAPWAR